MDENETWLRYSGDVTVSVTLTPLDRYICIVRDDCDEVKQEVGPPAFLRVALDCDEAIDAVAIAALSFATHDQPDAFQGIAFKKDMSGVHVARSEEDRYGSA